MLGTKFLAFVARLSTVYVASVYKEMHTDRLNGSSSLEVMAEAISMASSESRFRSTTFL